MYCFNCTDFNTIYIYTSKSYPCKALAVLGLSAKCRQCRQNPYLPKKKNAVNPLNLQRFLSGDGGIRTHDLYTASVALSQLSYAPESGFQLRPFSASFQRLFSGSFFQIPFPSLFSRAFFHGLFFKQSVQSKPEQPGSVSRQSSQIAVRLLILLLTYCRFSVDNIRDSVYSKVAFKALERASPIRFLCFIFSGGVLSCKMHLMTHLRRENPETNRKKACNVST